jgi:hypothetical protein
MNVKYRSGLELSVSLGNLWEYIFNVERNSNRVVETLEIIL